MSRCAVLIAATAFPDNPDLPSLTTPLNDIKALSRTLEDRSRGAFDRVDVLVDENAPDIARTLESAIQSASDNGFLLIYYSGHGLLDPQNQLYLATRDATPHAYAGLIKFRDISDWVSNHGLKRGLIVLDCCYSGAAGGDLEPRGIGEDQVRGSLDRQGYTAAAPSVLESRGIQTHSASVPGYNTGSGIYLMTACSPLQVAEGDKAVGFGLFSRHVIDGLSAEASVDHPEDMSKGIITARNLYGYVARKLREEKSQQTPMFWSKHQVGPDLIISEIELTGRSDPAIQPENRWITLQHQRSSVLIHVGPAYFLDNSFAFLDWNWAFEDLIAKPLGLKRGDHVDTFLTQLENWAVVKRRSMSRFAPGRLPLFDIEPFEYKSPKFGRIVFEKLASQLTDDTGRRVAWCVNLNVSSVSSRRPFWEHLEKIMNREALWSNYAHQYDQVIGSFEGYQKLRSLVASFVKGARQCLDLGVGTGGSTIAVLEANPLCRMTSVDANETMLRVFDAKLRARGDLMQRTVLLKGDIFNSLREFPDGAYDACVMLNVLFALDDPLECLLEIRRILGRRGILALSTSHTHTNVGNLFSSIYASLKRRMPLQEFEPAWEAARQRNMDMNDLITRHSLDDIRTWITAAGFDIGEWRENEYVGCVVAVRAVKKD